MIFFCEQTNLINGLIEYSVNTLFAPIVQKTFELMISKNKFVYLQRPSFKQLFNKKFN